MGFLYGNITMADVKRLQEQWIFDPAWDIETTIGYEDWSQYLLKWRKEYEASESTKESKRLIEKATKLGCGIELVGYIEALERRLARLEAQP